PPRRSRPAWSTTFLWRAWPPAAGCTGCRGPPSRRRRGIPCCSCSLIRPIWCWVVVFKRAEAGPPTYGRGCLFDGNAHRPGGTGDDLGGCVDVVGVEIGFLGLGDLADLIPADLGDLGLVRLRRALAHTGSLEQQLRGRRCLERESEAAVLVDRDLHRDDLAALVLRGGVVGLAELHDVDAVLAERGSHRRRRVGLPGHDLQLDQPNDFLLRGHEMLVFLPG